MENPWKCLIQNHLQLFFLKTQIFTNALCLRLKEEKKEELSRFEKLISDLSARFINIPISLLDDQIERALEMICRELDIELSTLWQWSDSSPHYLTLTHLYTPPYGPEKPEGIKAEEAFPWVIERLTKGETLTIYTEKMPTEAQTDKASREGFDIQSSVVLPLCSGEDQLIGAMSFDGQADRQYSGRIHGCAAGAPLVREYSWIKEYNWTGTDHKQVQDLEHITVPKQQQQ